MAALQVLAGESDERSPSIAYLACEIPMAQAWVAAAEGAVTAAVRSIRQVAEIVQGRSQLAVEVVALHTAVQFGDRSVAGRLAELATQVDGPRAPAAAAHAAALAADDGEAARRGLRGGAHPGPA